MFVSPTNKYKVSVDGILFISNAQACHLNHLMPSLAVPTDGIISQCSSESSDVELKSDHEEELKPLKKYSDPSDEEKNLAL
ncbi:hypothetical protein TNCV_2535331 [Trichonephila clavipes]|nr:hypothetical protein TNCV_2535331 [Trichonephila clavipes]